MVKYAKTPKSFINIKDLGFALLETDELDGTIKYSNVTQTRGLQEISVETGGEIVNAYTTVQSLNQVLLMVKVKFR